MPHWIMCPHTGQKYYRSWWDPVRARQMIVRSIRTGKYLGEVMVEVRKLERNWQLLHPEEHKALVELRELERKRIQSHEDELVERVAKHLPAIELCKIWLQTVKRLRVYVELGIGGDEAREEFERVLAGGERIQDRVRAMMKERCPREYARDWEGWEGSANG
jgi:hypothetical protein